MKPALVFCPTREAVYRAFTEFLHFLDVKQKIEFSTWDKELKKRCGARVVFLGVAGGLPLTLRFVFTALPVSLTIYGGQSCHVPTHQEDT